MAREQIHPERHHDTAAEVRIYLTIFGALGALTLLTVGVAYMQLPHAAGVVIALLIAAVKVYLIAAFFMHLRSEHRLINVSVAVCLALVLVLIVFVLPDLGIHELEERSRLEAQHSAVYHEAGAEAPESAPGAAAHGEAH
ncbi:MAG TPA: cytochrome C oxidase subunit IV family protein [Candidatus Binatia bacterium]|nr:cytochrome C oxidase subunit IV family protein [Candidatus Binatia bacterium]